MPICVQFWSSGEFAEDAELGRAGVPFQMNRVGRVGRLEAFRLWQRGNHRDRRRIGDQPSEWPRRAVHVHRDVDGLPVLLRRRHFDARGSCTRRRTPVRARAVRSPVPAGRPREADAQFDVLVSVERQIFGSGLRNRELDDDDSIRARPRRDPSRASGRLQRRRQRLADIPATGQQARHRGQRPELPAHQRIYRLRSWSLTMSASCLRT